MVDAQWISDLVRTVVPDAEVHASDLNGGGDHWHVVVISESFATVRSFQRQRPILSAVAPYMQSGEVHAFDVKCITFDELRDKFDNKIPGPFIPHHSGGGDHPGAW